MQRTETAVAGLLFGLGRSLPAGAVHSQASEARRVSASRLELSSRKSLTFHHPREKSGLPITFNCPSKPRECALFSLFLGKRCPFLCSRSKSALIFFLEVAIWVEVLFKSSEVRYLESKMKPVENGVLLCS